ncbi:MAG: Fic family protein [Candidatus Micrarchaeota archaeon]|nr:Fic family protein [Candidatus Micrarchaeota archaeon]
MALIVKRIHGKPYYYSFISYRLLDGPRSFSRYIGRKRPGTAQLTRIENSFKDSVVERLAGRRYTEETLDKDDVIRSLLFRDLFNKRYGKLTLSGRRKYDIDSTVLFTLTTLTTEDVDVDARDVRNAIKRTANPTQREQISRSMLNAVESIRQPHTFDKEYIMELHRIAMASFLPKSPGRLRERQVYLQRATPDNPLGREIRYRPPHHAQISRLLDEFVEWYNSSKLNPIEKAAVAHYRLYRIHPFLDGNKRVCRLIFNKTLLDAGFPLLNVSVQKERYFDALVDSVENDKADALTRFALKQFFRQVREFLKG